MPPAPLVRILLVGDPAPADVPAALEAAGFTLSATGFAGIDPAAVARSQAVVMAVEPKGLATAQALCRRWRIELGEQFVPIVWVVSGDVAPAAGLDAGADAVLRDTAAPAQLVAQV